MAAQSGSGPSLSQLRQAIVSEQDLDDEWIELDADVLDERYPAVYADFVGSFTDDFLSFELHDARNGVPDVRALSFLDGFDLDRLTQIEPTGYRENGVRYRYAYTDDGDRWYGEVAAWRQGQVVVAVLIESLDPDVCVCDVAALQYDKLAATIR